MLRLSTNDLDESMSALDIQGRHLCRRPCSSQSQAHLTVLTDSPLLHGVATTVHQDHNCNDDSGIGDETSAYCDLNGTLTTSGQPRKMVPLPSMVASQTAYSGAQKPNPAKEQGSTSNNGVTGLKSVFAIRLTASGPSLISTNTARLQVEGLMLSLLLRSQSAGLAIHQLAMPVFFEPPCRLPRKPQQQQHPDILRPIGILKPNSQGNVLTKYYRPTWCLGEGMFGQVYMAQVESAAPGDSPVPAGRRALKVGKNLAIYRKETWAHCQLQRGHTEESYTSTFLLWMDACVRLRHESATQPQSCLVLELAPGGSLYDLVHSLSCIKRRMHERPAAFYLAELACAIDYLHSRSILHLDVKADNVLLSATGHVRLSDFGQALKLDDAGHARRYVRVSCSTYHLPPEVLRSADPDGRQTTGNVLTKVTDWFSYGCLAYWLLHFCYPMVPPKCIGSADEYAKFMEGAGYARLDRAFHQKVSPAYRRLVSDLLNPCPELRLCCFARILALHRDVFADCVGDAARHSDIRALVQSGALLPPFVPLPL